MNVDKTALKRVCKQIESLEDEAIKLETGLTALPALSPENNGDGEEKKAEFLISYLENELNCASIQRYDAPDKRTPTGYRPNIVATFAGKNTDKTIWIMSHMDVVPPGDPAKWNSDPWTVAVKDGKIYGRGTEDNQQGIVSSLLTMKGFIDSDVQPEHNMALLFVADEETGSHYGIQHITANHLDLFTKDDFIIIPDAGNAEGTLVEVAEKSIIWFKFTVQGKQTHGSTPELGVNAHNASAHLIVKLNELYDIYPVSDAVFEPPISTFEPTKKEANVPNINTIPGEDVFYYDCRILPCYQISEVKETVRKLCDEIEQKHNVTIKICYEQDLEAPAPTPVDAPVVEATVAAIADIKGIKPTPMGIGGGTVAAFFRQAGLHAVVWATQDETLHEPNEYATIANILNDAKVFAHIAMQH